MGKNKKRKKPKKKGPPPKAPRPKAPKPKLVPTDDGSPAGPNLDAGPYVGPVGDAPPERKAWHILLLVAIGGAAVLGLGLYQQITVHSESDREEQRFQEEKAKKKARDDAAAVGTQTTAGD